ncbi:ankyrin repeat domain-containing protein [Novosphingobium sp. FSY-8]|uniref:Ankyrin repeat domain-containing protein n=1 Tax=Novosphingobium ovatum TaxID=1908523 RepID=A0ABW9XFH7_9SPHN|nr:ankyrin repeat domain-containing protein [Novosphingobium ovatum]NBC37304.1 ankyrin repeat domain-containing protein [Novosphingobium ovatum]
MAQRVWVSMIAALAGLALLAPTPAAAQFQKGYKFLESVRKREGQEVTDALSEPGTTIVNTQDSTTGETALHIVTARRDAAWIAFLISRGADPNIRDNKGATALVIASNLGFVEGAQALINAGARVDETGSTGETPLIFAVHRRDLAMMRVLLKAGANPDRADSSGRSARDYAKLDRGGTVLQEIESNAKSGPAGGGPVYGPRL